MALSAQDTDNYIKLFRGNIIPLHACLPGLTWILHDYLVTLEDEPQPWTAGKFLFIWIRYYGIALLIFDVTQIHLFTRPGITSDTVCVAMDSVIRIVGAILLWSIEIVMQLRIYAIFKCSIKVAAINFILFLASIGGFMYILIFNAIRRHAVIADWAQWVPATGFEGALFLWALYRTLSSTVGKWRRGSGLTLYELVLRDNVLYFFGITCLLIFNNLMVVGATKIPWFSYSPFHAAMEIMTSRMLINLYKAANGEKEVIYPEMSTSTMTVFSAGVAPSPVDSLNSPKKKWYKSHA
ncbi:hypothetical protein BDQ17DRAFT_1374699 [Cyathus striatus]|nr:hypothetical protein BDQ17DRAFT_1374699 [Cyathus striatus]